MDGQLPAESHDAMGILISLVFLSTFLDLIPVDWQVQRSRSVSSHSYYSLRSATHIVNLVCGRRCGRVKERAYSLSARWSLLDR